MKPGALPVVLPSMMMGLARRKLALAAEYKSVVRQKTLGLWASPAHSQELCLLGKKRGIELIFIKLTYI